MSDDEKVPPSIIETANRMLNHITYASIPSLPDRVVRGFCSHLSSAIDASARRVWCRRCGAPLDAFDVLAKLSREFGQYRDLLEQRNRLRREVEALTEEHKRVKANKRAAEKRRNGKGI